MKENRDLRTLYRTSAPRPGWGWDGYKKRPMKETYKRELLKRHRTETYGIFIAPQHRIQAGDAMNIQRDLWKRNRTKTYEREIEQRPTKSLSHLSTASRLRMRWTFSSFLLQRKLIQKETYERNLLTRYCSDHIERYSRATSGAKCAHLEKRPIT